MYPEANTPNLRIRFAQESDCALILEFIRSLAAYEKMENLVIATEEGLRESLFQRKQAEVIIGEENNSPVAFALFFHNYSTFQAKANLYLEDLFVKNEYRGRGFGGAMLRCLAGIAVERGCQRLDWSCLDWNTPSITFYRKLGAAQMSEWTGFRLEGESLLKLASSGQGLCHKGLTP